MPKSKLLGDVVRTLPKKMVGDMAMRTDALLDSEMLTSIIHKEAPASILSFFGRAVGDILPRGMGVDNTDPWFSIETSGLAASYINIREETTTQDPLRVYDNSTVPAIIPPNSPFQVSLDRGILDDDESFMCRDQKTVGRVLSSQIGIGSTLYTVVINGMPGETFDGRLFSVGSPISYKMGNSQGEFSAKSNIMPGDSEQYNNFFNPMMITRYKLPMSGSWMSDEFYVLRQKALDGSISEVNTGLSKRWLRAVLEALDRQLLFSRSNFDPKTKKILGRSSGSRNPERPTYAGFYQMMDQAPVQYEHDYKSSKMSGLQKIDRIIQTLSEQPGSRKTVFAMCQGTGYQWLQDVILEAGMQKSPIQITVSPDKDNKVTVGWALDHYTSRHGNLFLYNVGQSMAFSGEVDLTTYGGTKSGPRGNDIFFFNGARGGGDRPTSKIAKYYSKEGQVEGYGKVNRGFVFGVSKGLTGQGNGMTGTQAMALQDSAIEGMINDPQYFLGSLVDGNEYHCLVEGVPYFDPRGTIKLNLLGGRVSTY